ncbi:MAG: HAMP domain-containing histidine kinase [Thaumarchaeota archaeon]|nr:HAMP domain-containing histidine kinase [Nitrososphaerota archaeon]
MNHQKTSTGFRIGASVGIIILMLGIAISLSISITATISDQMKVVANYNIPLEKITIQMRDTQKNQESVLDNAVRFLHTGDTQGLQLSENEFFAYDSLMTSQIIQTREIANTGLNILPQEYVSPSASSVLAKMENIEKSSTEYEQAVNNVFSLSDKTDNVKLDAFTNDLKNKEEALDAKQNNLLADMESSYQNIEISMDENKQKFLTLEIMIIISIGIISLASGYFVNQINKDLTREVIKKTKSLQKTNEKLRKLNVLKDEFISEASHELKSPLNPIYGFVELAKCGDIDKEEALAGIVKQAHQIEEVANKMLDLGKIDNNRLHLSIERFNLAKLVSDISEATRTNLDENVSIEMDSPVDLEVEADRIRIGQVIRNILNNSVKFTPRGGIFITLSLNGANAQVRISDTGIGIHPDVLPKMFDKFVTKSHRKENLDGNGLGLYMCKGIIIAHSGEINAYNNPKGGATVFFSIPLTHGMNNKTIQRSLLN